MSFINRGWTEYDVTDGLSKKCTNKELPDSKMEVLKFCFLLFGKQGLPKTVAKNKKALLVNVERSPTF